MLEQFRGALHTQPANQNVGSATSHDLNFAQQLTTAYEKRLCQGVHVKVAIGHVPFHGFDCPAQKKSTSLVVG